MHLGIFLLLAVTWNLVTMEKAHTSSLEHVTNKEQTTNAINENMNVSSPLNNRSAEVSYNASHVSQLLNTYSPSTPIIPSLNSSENFTNAASKTLSVPQSMTNARTVIPASPKYKSPLNNTSESPQTLNTITRPVISSNTTTPSQVINNTLASSGNINASQNSLPPSHTTSAPAPSSGENASEVPITSEPSKIPLFSNTSFKRNVPVFISSRTPNALPSNIIPKIPEVQKSANKSTDVPNFKNMSNMLKPAEVPNSRPDSTEAIIKLLKSLEMLTDMYKSIPNPFGFLGDAPEIGQENNAGKLQNPFEKFNVCTLSTKVGDERGPITVLVAAEDEKRMTSPESFYVVGQVHPEKQRSFTSFCSGREDHYLTFNPGKNK